MGPLQQIRRLWAHAEWADEALFEALKDRTELADAWREYAHVLGAEETWLSRLEGRAAEAAVWPTLTVEQAGALREWLRGAYRAYLDRLDPADLGTSVDYTNSAGKPFSTDVGDILVHVALHGQYHRGKVNLLLRGAGAEPAPVDFIAYVRGAPAAVTQPPP